MEREKAESHESAGVRGIQPEQRVIVLNSFRVVSIDLSMRRVASAMKSSIAAIGCS
jgi:hypothetical protein